MKKLLLLFIILAGFFSSNADSIKRFDIRSNDQAVLTDCKYGQCHATAKSTGARCRHCVSSSGDLYCWQHK